jgi:hypothetical protein
MRVDHVGVIPKNKPCGGDTKPPKHKEIEMNGMRLQVTYCCNASEME